MAEEYMNDTVTRIFVAVNVKRFIVVLSERVLFYGWIFPAGFYPCNYSLLGYVRR